MIEVTTEIKEYEEEGEIYIMKEYTMNTSYPSSVAKIYINGLLNQIYTNHDGIGNISISNLGIHHLEIQIENETFTDNL